MKFIKKLHENRKTQFAIVASIAALLFIFGWKMEARNLATELPLETNAISEIQNEANSVKLARDNYFSMVGKDNGGAYDEYQNALICEENLDLRTEETKNLRAEYQRLISEIELRERELRAAKTVVEFEEKAVEKIAEIISAEEVATLQERETIAQTKFEKAGSDLKSCIEAFQNLEKCETATQAFLKEQEAYLSEVYIVESIIKEKQTEAEKQLKKMQKNLEEEWYQSEQKNKYKRISEFLNKIQAKNLKASYYSTQSLYFEIEDTSINVGDKVRWKYLTTPLAADHYEFRKRLEGSDTWSNWAKLPAGDCTSYNDACSEIQNTPGVFEMQVKACGNPGLGSDCTTAIQQKWGVESAAYPTNRVFELQDSSVNVWEDIYFKYSADGANHYKFMYKESTGTWGTAWTPLLSAPCSYTDAWCKTQLTTPGTYDFKLAACGDSTANYCLSKTQSIVVNTPINGTCGAAHQSTFSSATDVNAAGLCVAGTPNPAAVTSSGPWAWSCDSVNGGTTTSCTASLSTAPIDGVCGAAHLGTFGSTTDVNTAGLCVAGTPNPAAVTSSGPWTWSCDGVNGSNNSSACSANLSVPFGDPSITFSMYFNGYEWEIIPDISIVGKYKLYKVGTPPVYLGDIENMKLLSGSTERGIVTYDPAKNGYGFITITSSFSAYTTNSTNMLGFAIEGSEMDPVIFSAGVNSQTTDAEKAQVVYDFKQSTGLSWTEIASLYSLTNGDKLEVAEIETFVNDNLSIVDGVCGTADTGTFGSASEANTAGLCTTGDSNPTVVIDPGPWIWVCEGVNNGQNSPACNASLPTSPIADCGNGNIDPGEQCEPPNTATCNASCQNITPSGSSSNGSSSSTIGNIALGAVGALGIAGALGVLGSDGGGIGSSISNIASGAINGVFGGLTKGAAFAKNSIIDPVINGINGVANALGLGNPFASAGLDSGMVFDGPGAIDGLETFQNNYAGNTYGSAIGMITGWTNFLLPFVGAIAIAAIVYAGFLYLTAAGNDEQAGKAKKIIIWVVIGIIVIFSAYAIVNTLLGSDSGGGNDGTSISVGGLSVEF